MEDWDDRPSCPPPKGEGQREGVLPLPITWSRTSRPRTFIVRGATCLPEFLISQGWRVRVTESLLGEK